MRLKYKSLEEMIRAVQYRKEEIYAPFDKAKYKLLLMSETDTYQLNQPAVYDKEIVDRYYARNLPDLHLICADQLHIRSQLPGAEPRFGWFDCQYINTESFALKLWPERFIGTIGYGCEYDDAEKKRTCRRIAFYAQRIEKEKVNA